MFLKFALFFAGLAAAQQQGAGVDLQGMLQKAMQAVPAQPAGASAADKASQSDFGEDNWQAVISGVKGEAYVQAGEAANWTAARKGLPLKTGDSLKTGEGSRLEISFDSDAIVELEPQSSLKLAALSYDGGSLSLHSGALAAKFTNMVTRSLEFSADTPEAGCSFKSAEFALERSLDDENTIAGVLLGKLTVRPAGEETGGTVLRKLKEAHVSSDGVISKPRALSRLVWLKSRSAALKKKLAVFAKNWKRMDADQCLKLRQKFMGGAKASAGKMPTLKPVDNFTKRERDKMGPQGGDAFGANSINRR